MPQRCICRQSKIGAANPVAAALMSPAFSPLRMRIATAAVIRLDSSTECIGPPTIASPKKEPSYEKMGALAEEESLQRFVGLVRNPRRIDIHQMPEDRAV